MEIKIVIVDDDRITRALLEKILIMKGFWVYSAKDGEEGLELAKKEDPSLVISDMLMPKLHGYDLCREIKNSDETKHIKVLLMTAVYKNNLAIKQQAKDCGAEDVISKPIDMDLMLKRIYELLDIKKDDLKNMKNDGDSENS
ncbi:MAG TPA: response regulator [Acidobacteriota bacterium]|jgi:DNA-binding response OmpR family regulator|nr:response regulator [Acidobacteriota bacterium]